MVVMLKHPLAVRSLGGRAAQEDQYVMHREPGFGVFAVFDGHGGGEVSEMCKRDLVPIVRSIVKGTSALAPEALPKLMVAVFEELDRRALALNKPTVGSTAVVLLDLERHVVCANCGDSLAFVSNGKDKMTVLTRDHKVENEIPRLKKAGAIITHFPGDTPRIMASINLARSIGDHHLKKFVSSRPWVAVLDKSSRGAAPRYAFLASDGVWDVLSPAQVNERLGADVPATPARGQQAAPLRAIEQRCRELGSRDNITALLVPLSSVGGKTRPSTA